MVKQLGAVFNSYVQRCRSLIPGTFLICGLLQVVLTLWVASQPQSLERSIPFLAMGMMFLGVLVWVHLREQLLNSRRFHWPNYLPSQLIVFASFASLLALAWPMAFSVLSSETGPGLVVAFLMFFAAVGWCIVTLSPVLMMILTAAYLAVCVGLGWKQLTFLDTRPDLGAVVIIAAMLLTCAAVWRLTRMDERNRSYNKKLSLQGVGLLPKMTGQMAEPRAAWSGWRKWFEPRLESYLPRSGGQWQRSKRLRMMCQSSLWFSVIMACSMVIPQLLIVNAVHSLGNLDLHAVFPLFMFVTISGSSIAVRWMQSWRYLDVEFARPIGRKTLLKDLAAAIAVQSLQVWTVLIIMLVCVLVLKGVLFANVSGVAALVAVSFADQALSLAIAFLVMPLRSPIGVSLAGFPVSLISIGLLLLCYLHPAAAIWIAPTGVATLLLSAVALLPLAARRWEVADIG